MRWRHEDFALTRLHICVWQGHIGAAEAIGDIHFWGQGAAIDYPRAMAAYKVGAEGGDAFCQWEVGFMYSEGLGVAVDLKQARAWLEKAAAGNIPAAFTTLWVMYLSGDGVTPSFRRARELYQRSIELGESQAVEGMQNLTMNIQKVS